MISARYVIEDAQNLSAFFRKKRLGKCDLIITSPPYYDVKTYAEKNAQIGYGQSYEEYLTSLVSVLEQCDAVTKRNATMWLVVDTISRNGVISPLPFDINERIRRSPSKISWNLRDVIIWDKLKNVPWQYRGRFRNQFEYVLFFTKGKRYKYNVDRIREVTDYKKWWLTYPERYNPKGKAPTNIWQYAIPIRGWGNGYQQHLCPFPFALVERIIALASNPGDLVLDPFAGSGTVLAMAAAMGRRSIGFDISADYKRKFEKQVLRGALRYWEERSATLDQMAQKIANFKRSNAKLRKVKAASLVRHILGNSAPRDTRAILLAGRGFNACQLILVTHHTDRLKKLLSMKQDAIEEGLRPFHLEMPYKVLKPQTLVRNLGADRKLYRYAPDAIFSYTDAIIVATLVKEQHRSLAVLSDLALKFEKADYVMEKA